MTLNRHGRACPGHPRLAFLAGKKDVDARDKRGHDAAIYLWKCAP
jgi:hypothetical protein